MLVFGDRSRQVVPGQQLAALAGLLRRSASRGRERHDQLVRALLEAGELAQGLADAEFASRGCDDDTPLQATALAFVVAIARKVEASWSSGFASEGPEAWDELAALAAAAPAEPVRCKLAEGHAHYAVYPEAYMAAGAELRGAPTLVIGLRSIGVTLAAAAAAGSRAPKVVTLRPYGPPSQRRLAVSPRLAQALAEHAGLFAVADEGPGLSGSSFGAVGDLLAGLGIGGERIVYLPSHAGAPGPAAQARHRDRWRGARRLVRQLEDIAPPSALAGWFDDLTGGVERVEDLSHGGWRAALPAAERPPIWAASERRKFRLTAASGTYLARFAGLGRLGAAKLERARALHAAGFAAEPLALTHGFLLERWIDGTPLQGDDAAPPRLGEYLNFRRRRLPAAAVDGDGEVLRTMARVNAEESGGGALADLVARRLDRLARLETTPEPVQVDGRLHRWEWVRVRDGSLRKTDALDHCCGHDLIGCQDVGWDLAGAVVEFGLDPAAARELERQALGRPDPLRTQLYCGLYCAFQTGLWSMAEQGAVGPDRARAAAQAKIYAAALRRWAALPG